MTSITTSLCVLSLFVATGMSNNCTGLNRRTELCCHRSVEQRYTTDGREKGCCFNQTFFPDTQLCCNKSVVPRKAVNGDVTKCCGGIEYTLQDQNKLCCNDNLHTILHDEKATCCGKSKIDRVHDVCCKDSNGNKKVHKKVPNMKCCQSGYYNKISHYCNRNRYILPHHISRCGSQTYDVRSQRCCGGVIHTLNEETYPHYGCCGAKIYNTKEQKCCAHENMLIPVNLSCCTRGSFNMSTERCCVSGPIKFTKHTEECCGNGLYDSAVQGCCGSKSYNKFTHQCCFSNGAIIPRNSYVKCCREMTYNSSTDVCCINQDKGKVVAKVQRNHDSCCLSETSGKAESYSSRTHYCSLGTVISVKTKMCGASVVDVDKDICCHGVLHKDGKSKGRRCCGVVTYLPKKQVCCDTTVFNKRKHGRCGKHSYRISPMRKGISPMKKRIQSNSKPKGICRYCKKSRRSFTKAIKSNSICRLQAFKVKIVAQRPFRRNYQWTRIIMYIQKDLFSKNKTRKRKIKIHVPGRCLISFKFAILSIRTVDFNRPNRLSNSDIFLPWSSKIGKVLKRQQGRCKSRTLIISKNNLGYKHYNSNAVPQVFIHKTN